VYMTNENDVLLKFMLGTKKVLEDEMGLLWIAAFWNEKLEDDLEPLQELVKIKEEDLPSIFMIHGDTQEVVRYPDILDDWAIFNSELPELIVNWAKLEILEKDIPRIQANLESDDLNNEEKEEFLRIL